MKSWTGLDGKGFGYGYIAEDLDALGLTNLVFYDDQGRPDGIVSRAIPFYMLEIVKKQQAAIADHETQNAALEARLAALEEAMGVEANGGQTRLLPFDFSMIWMIGAGLGLILGGPGLVLGYRRFRGSDDELG